MLPEDIKKIKSKNLAIHGHRGARGLYPENTISAFLEAVKLGVDALEMDIVISKDGKVVVSHEAWMNPLICIKPDGGDVEDDPRKYNLYQMNYEEIRSYDCGSKRHPGFPRQQPLAEHKPLLRDVFTAIETYIKRNLIPPVKYNIEIKTEFPDGLFNPSPSVFIKLLHEEIKDIEKTGRIHLQSFDARILQEIKTGEFGVSIGLLIEDKDPVKVQLDRLGFIPDVYSPEFILLQQELLKEVQQSGMLCIPWTVNEPEDMLRLLEWGVDGLITDYPDKAIGLMNRKN